MPAFEAPPDEGDEAPRQSYNFAPGYNGIVYRADVPEWGAGQRHHKKSSEEEVETAGESEEGEAQVDELAPKETRYKLQSMRWGLIPFWTKRSPDYSSMLKTINCRADSLSTSTGMWNAIKGRKRCIVVCQGFYEWLKNPHNPKDKTPHFVKRKDGKLMCMAGLWDCVRYEGAQNSVWSYTVITTDSNKQLNFLHDRMPVIMENGSEELRAWLDPKRDTWNGELQSMLKPFKGELEVYPVSSEVGKVGNNSERFIIPVDSTKNKANIANFFANAKSDPAGRKPAVKKTEDQAEIKTDPDETRKTIDHSGSENNAPLPIPQSHTDSPPTKRKRPTTDDDNSSNSETTQPPLKNIKKEEEQEETQETQETQAQAHPSPKKTVNPLTPEKKKIPTTSTRKTRSATSNGSKVLSPGKGAASASVGAGAGGGGLGQKKITGFFGK